MALTLKVKRGYTAVAGVPIDYAALNAGFLPIITLEGTTSTTDIQDGAIHANHVTPDAYWYAVDSDVSANLIVATYVPAAVALVDGLVLAVKVKGQNTGPVTFNPNGLGAKKLLKFHDAELESADLEDNMIIEMRYDVLGDGGAGAWQLLTPVATTGNASSLRMVAPATIRTYVDAEAWATIDISAYVPVNARHALLYISGVAVQPGGGPDAVQFVTQGRSHSAGSVYDLSDVSAGNVGGTNVASITTCQYLVPVHVVGAVVSLDLQVVKAATGGAGGEALAQTVKIVGYAT